MKGLIGGGDKVETWGVADTIAGGTAGSKMDLTALVGDGAASPTGNVSTIGRSTSGIETFNITFKDASAAVGTLTVDTSSLAGAKNFNIVSATVNNENTHDEIKFDGLLKSQAVTVKSAESSLDVALNYADAENAGKEDIASFAVNGAKVGNVTVSNKMEAVHVTATGANEVAGINAIGATKFAIDGTGSLEAELVGTAGKIAEIDASAAKGQVDLDITAAHLNTTKATIKGGTATDDVLGVSGNITSKMTVSGFETVGLNGNDSTFDMINVTGATTVANFNAGPGADRAALIVKNATGVTNLLMEGTGKADAVNADMHIGGITFEAKAAQGALAVAINNDGMALDTLTGSTTEAKIYAHALTIKNVKDITINAADADVVLTSLAADKMESLTVKATEDFTITDAVTFSNAAKVNMAGVVGDVSMTMQGSGGSGAFTTALTYTGSSAADTLTFDALTGKAGDKVAYTIDTGAGNDVVTLSGATGAKTASVLTMTLGEGNDNLILDTTFTIDASGDGQTINFGDGTGDSLTYDGTSAALDLSAATVTGLEELKLTAAANNKLTINDETANGLKIVHAYTDNTVLNVTMTKGNDLDVRGLILNGNGAKLNITGSASTDKIIGSDYAGTITGGAGADKITLGAGANKVVYTTMAEGSADETISGFTVAGAEEDVISFTKSGFVGSGSNLGNVGAAVNASTSTGSDLTYADTNMYIMNVASFADSSAMITAFKGLFQTAATSGNNTLVVWNDNVGADAGTYVSVLSATASDTVLAGTVANIDINLTGIGELLIGNFAFA